MTRYIKVQNRGINQIANTEWVAESEISGGAVEVVTLSQTVTLTDAQIKALPTAGVEILSPADASDFYILESCAIIFHLVQDYAAPGDTEAYLSIRYGPTAEDVGGPEAVLRMPMAWSFTDFGAPLDVCNVFRPKLNTDGAGGYFSQTGLGLEQVKGAGLYLFGSNVVDLTPVNLSGGNASNSASLSVSYRQVVSPY